MIQVRAAHLGDLDWLMRELKAFSHFYGSKKPLYGGDAYATQAITGMIENHVLLVAEREDGERMGFIGGVVQPHPMNPEISTLTELFWWVPETHRGCRAGLMLLNAFIDWGQKHCDWVLMTLEHNSPISERCLTTRGFIPKERSYLLEVG